MARPVTKKMSLRIFCLSVRLWNNSSSYTVGLIFCCWNFDMGGERKRRLHRPGQALRALEIEASRTSRQSARESGARLSSLHTGRMYSSIGIRGTHFYYSLSRPESQSPACSIMPMKNPMTPSRNPKIFRLIAQSLAKLCHSVSLQYRRLFLQFVRCFSFLAILTHMEGRFTRSQNYAFMYLHTYLLLAPRNRLSASQEIPLILWNPNVHYRIHKCLCKWFVTGYVFTVRSC